MTQQRTDDASMSSHRTRTNTRAQQIAEADAVEAISAARTDERIASVIRHQTHHEVMSDLEARVAGTLYPTDHKTVET